MTVLDSSVWIALFNESDSQHAKADRIFQSLQSTIILPEYVLLEVCTILTQKAGKEVSHAFLATAFENEDVDLLVVDELFFYELIDKYRASKDEKLSFVDVALLSLASTYDVITFDQKLSRAIVGRKRVEAR